MKGGGGGGGMINGRILIMKETAALVPFLYCLFAMAMKPDGIHPICSHICLGDLPVGLLRTRVGTMGYYHNQDNYCSEISEYMYAIWI